MPKNQSLSPIQQVQGRPTIVRGDEISSQAVYCDYILDEEWEERIAEFIQSGVKIFHLRVANGSRIGADDFYDSAFWTDDNTFPESDAEHCWSLGNQARFVLERCPEAQFFIKFMTAPPEAFTKKHPDEMQTDENGETYRQPSLSSERYHNQLRKYLKILIGFCENQAWASHIVGYLGMPIGEGILPLNIAGKMFDRSPANRRAFRRWLQEKYDNPK
ncbi:MAG: hypothetical protein KGZ25_08375, partial [Planctomycetes bacterium]|nr:hypothetical protein [Planctomycetota bacterium]